MKHSSIFVFLLLSAVALHAQDAKTAARYQASCDAGYAPDCLALADLYASGKGVPQSTVHGSALVQKAIDLDMKACQQGNKSDACIQAGDLYAKYANDQVAANLLYRKACNLDNAPGCNKVAVLYENGTGIPKDNATAADYYSRACKLGNKPACGKAQALAPK